jgi:hypothetical protein
MRIYAYIIHFLMEQIKGNTVRAVREPPLRSKRLTGA